MISVLIAGIVALNPLDSLSPKLIEARADCETPVTLLQFSDLHGDCENLRRVCEFKKAYAAFVDDAVHCGDAVACYSDDIFPWDAVPEARDILNAVGNHDCWKGHLVWAQTDHPYDATVEEAYSIVMEGRRRKTPFIDSWGVVRPEGRCTWYHKDYDSLRLIVLDAIHFDSAQREWFERVLEEARLAGKPVAAVSHYQPQGGLDKMESGFSSRMEDVRPVADPGSAQMERLPDAAFSVVDAFVGRGGTFVCWLTGHTHLDMIGRVTGHPSQIMITVDKAGEKDVYMGEERIRGQKSQDSFNLVTINPCRGIVTVDRVGCTRDEEGRSKTRFRFSYLTSEVLVNE